MSGGIRLHICSFAHLHTFNWIFLLALTKGAFLIYIIVRNQTIRKVIINEKQLL